MATTIKHEIGSWNTFHNNGPFPTKILYETSLETKGNMPSLLIVTMMQRKKFKV